MPARVLRSELLRIRVARFTRPLRGVEDGDVRALHRTRVASRRLREVLPVLQLDAATVRKLSRRLRKITARLGGVRELDVLLLLIDELHTARPALAKALQHTSLEVAKRREESRKRVFGRAPMGEMHRVARKLDHLAHDLKHDEASPLASTAALKSARWAIEARIVHRAARLQAAIGAAGALYLPERLHDVRIALKKLRYAVELAADVAGTRQTATLRTLHRTQGLLGRMHDLQVLLDCVRERQASLPPFNVALWRELDALTLMLEDDCRRLHGRYVGDRAALASIAGKLAARPAGRGRPDLPVDDARLRRRVG